MYLIDLINKNIYCNSLTAYSRWETREVIIGDIPMGASHPIRVQSMTNTLTEDSNATADQIKELVDEENYIRKIENATLN